MAKSSTEKESYNAIQAAKKRQYRQEIKEGKRVVIPKNSKGKVLTEKQKDELRKQQKRKHYKDNSKTILAYQAKYKRDKALEKKQIDAKKAIDAFNKLNGW